MSGARISSEEFSSICEVESLVVFGLVASNFDAGDILNSKIIKNEIRKKRKVCMRLRI